VGQAPHGQGLDRLIGYRGLIGRCSSRGRGRDGGVGGFAGFKGNSICGQRPSAEGGTDPGKDLLAGHVSVQQQDLDQGPGAFSVTMGLAGRSPPRLMGRGERTRGAGLLQGGRSREGAGFADERLEVMVQL